MLDSLFSASNSVEFSVLEIIINLVVSILLGLIVSVTYMKTNKDSGYSQSFVLTMVFLPVIVCMIIFLIGNNIARAFSLAGAFSIIRFRSATGQPKDIAFILFAMASGLACGVGSLWYGCLCTIVLCLLMILLSFIRFGENKTKEQILKITIPEDLAYEKAFDEVFNKFEVSYTLQKVRTTELGSLFELVYLISINELENKKEFLDAIRVRNGNLDISLTMAPQKQYASF